MTASIAGDASAPALANRFVFILCSFLTNVLEFRPRQNSSTMR
jgi:hypothetical protein